ncbi:MAG: PAS domain-containing protein [Calothrix sp. C42_A2020_038]|nr:PAS domain-containing protein [Calothrix sp. C42_A2020_038]
MYTQNRAELIEILLEHTPLAIAMFDREMRYIATSRKWLIDYNCTEQNLIGQHNCRVLPNIASMWKDAHDRCLRGEVHFTCEAQKFVTQASGSVDWLKWDCRPWYEQNGDIGGTIFYTEIVTEQKQAQEALRQTQSRFQKLAANVPGMIYQCLLTASGVFTLPYVSPGCRRLLELEPETLQEYGSLFYDFIHPEDKSVFQESMAISADTLLPWLWEGRMITTSGKFKWVRATARPEKQVNGDIIWDGLLIDISDRILAEAQLHQYKELLENLVERRTSELNTTNIQLQAEVLERQKVEFALRRSEMRFQKLSANIPGVLYQYVLCPDGSHHFSYISAGSRQIYELEPEQVLNDGEAVFRLVHPEDLPNLYQSVQLSAKTLEPWSLEWRIITPSGRLKWLQGSSRPEKQPNGDIVWDGLVMDVTERKRALEALCQSETRYRKLTANLPGMTFQFVMYPDKSYHFAYISPGSNELYGLEPEIIQQDTNRLLELIHTDDRAQLLQSVTISAETLQVWKQEWRVIRPSGAIKWVQALSKPEKQADGSIIWDGLMTDITERKVAEESLKLSEQKFRTLFEKSADGILIYDGEIFIDCNQAAVKMMGCSSQDQLLSLSPSQLSPEYQYDGRPSFEKAVELTNIAYEKGSHRFEWVHRRINGQDFPVEVLLTAIPLHGKEVFYTVWRDITDRKQAEEALRKSELRYKELARREQLLNHLANQIRNTLDLDTILETAIINIQQILHIDRCSFSWFKADANPPVWETVKEAKHPSFPSLLGCHPVDKIGPVTQMFVNQEILKIDDVTQFEESMHREFLKSLGIKSEIVLPIKTRSDQIGVIVCGHWTETRTWTSDEVELLQAVVDQLAIAINQAELYTQSQHSALIATQQAQQIENALEELKRTQMQLVQSEKMSSLGQLVAGVAHEINNPVNFIYGNLSHASNYTEDLLNLVELYQEEYPQPTDKIVEQIDAIDLDFLISDLPKIMSSMKVGSERIREIVQSLRTFSRLDEAEMKKVDIHEGIESSLMILQHRLKARQDREVIQVIEDYGSLPMVVCYAGQLNQVFLNILANAIDALEEGVEKGLVSQPTIRITTKMLENARVAIHIADNGVGMEAEVKKRLFDPFYTTKPVGVGTGLGLSISYQIIVDRHGGCLRCNSELGQGTEFVIEIPILQTGNT